MKIARARRASVFSALKKQPHAKPLRNCYTFPYHNKDYPANGISGYRMKKTGLFILLCLSSQLAFADRPWASESPDAEPAEAEPAAAFEPAPAVAPPASTQIQTGTVVEVQPGETFAVQLLDFPRRGMSMEKVQNELGRPIDISPTVGEPPITTWRYDDRKVFFEYDKVIHVVAIR